MRREEVPQDRRILAELSTDADGRKRVRSMANLLGLGLLIVIVLAGFGWAVVIEPSLSLRALAAAVIVGSIGFGGLAVILSRRAAARRPPNRVVVSDWGIEFDAPSRPPDLAPPESGGALSWNHIGRVEIDNTFWAMRRAGLFEVTFYSREFKRGSFGMTIPRAWPRGICVPYLRRDDAQKLASIAQSRNVASESRVK
jgi:hypothetical protein